ncbi:MAG: ribonuclease HII [Chloroflexota bacterium]|nr:ribonuclease HII [Chloroflexota bacterium]
MAAQGKSQRDGPTLDWERRLWAEGFRRVAGLDEAGRGALAGPVVAAAVILPCDPKVARRLDGVADSKTLTALRRERLFDVVMAESAGTGVGIVPARQIDEVGIAVATRQAMGIAVSQLVPCPDYLIIDYVRLPLLSTRQESLVKGDARVLSIAAASILAKVTRDRLMIQMAGTFSGYGFERHKGYGTRQHLDALRIQGPCPEHRQSFRPVRGLQASLFPQVSSADQKAR